jgi:hypothetical protein
VTDLERFFRRLVGNLASTDPARLHRPLPLADIQHDILPYRANRRALGLDSSEEYELVLLRLCAGEGGLVRAEPEEARARFAKELESPNPDLTVLDAFDSVLLTLRSEPLARALGPEPESAYAPSRDQPSAPDDFELPDLPDLGNQDEPAESDPEHRLDPASDIAGSTHCLFCGGTLPTHRTVKFCPHCGQNQTTPVCPQCHGELEIGWKHCVNCGTVVGKG